MREAFAERSAERYRELAEDGPVVFSVLEIDPDDADIEAPPRFRLRYISPQIQDILGYPAARFYADVWNWLSIVHPDDLDIGRGDEPTSHRRSPVERRLSDDRRRRAGRVDASGGTDRRAGRDGASPPAPGHHDGRHRPHGEGRAGAAGDRQLRSLVEQLPGVAWTYVVDDPADWRPIYIAPQVEQLLGYTSAELMAEPRFFHRLVHPEDQARVLELGDRSVRGQGQTWQAEYRVITRDGSIRWIRSLGNRGWDEHGRPVIHGLWLDITAERERDHARQDAATVLRDRADLSRSAAGRAPTPAGTGAASREARPSRPPADGSP